MRTYFSTLPLVLFVAFTQVNFALSAERVPVTLVPFTFSGSREELAARYPYSSRLVYQTEAASDGGGSFALKRNENADASTQNFYIMGPEGAAFYTALREAHYRIAAPLTAFELKSMVTSDDVDDAHRYGLTTTLVHESVYTVPVPDFNRRTRRWEDGAGVMAFFKLAFMIMVLDYGDNSIREAIPFTCVGKKLYSAPPTDAQLLEEMRKLYLGTADGEESLVTRQLARSLARVSFDGGARKTIQVSGVSFGADAGAAIGSVLERDHGTDYFVKVELSARLASLLNARVMPPLYDYSVNYIVIQNPYRESWVEKIPAADYLLNMEINSFGNAIAERTTAANAYALSATVRLGMTDVRNGERGSWSRESTVHLGKTRPIPKAMAEGWPFGVSYFDALPSLCRGVAEQIGEARQTAGWEF